MGKLGKLIRRLCS